MCKLLRATITFWFLFGSLTVFGQTTSIMTFNIRLDNPNDNQNSWNNRKNELAGLIEYYHPDIFGIEEGLSNQVDFIKRHSSNYNFIGIGREGGTKGEYSCIYYDTTKFELLYQTTFWLSDTPDTFSVGWDAALPRICTYGKFKNKSMNDKSLISEIPEMSAGVRDLGVSSDRGIFLTSLFLSQLISNVPAGIFISKFSHNWFAIAYGVNVAGNGLAIASLANIIALRLMKGNNIWLNFHKYSILFFLISGGIVYALFSVL